MLLFLDSDRNTATGWSGYDYLVNHEVIDDSATTLKAWRDGAGKPSDVVITESP